MALIHWGGIERIVYLPIFALFIVACIYNYRRINKSARLLFSDTNRKLMFKHFSFLRLFTKMLLSSLSILVMFLAFLQPQFGKKEQPVQQESRDLLILLDISHSMLAQDLKPCRLEFAKLKIRNLLSMLNFERVGLIVFSGNAFVQCPLTNDHSAFLMFLDQIDVESISSGTTALDNALDKALEVYKASQGRKNKMVLLISDGEDYSSNLEITKQAAAEENIKLFTLGLGSPAGAPIPKLDSMGKQIGNEVDENGQIAMSKLNETTLKGISEYLNGMYVRSSYDDSDINQIAHKIKSHEKEKFIDKKISLFEDQYHWLLAFAWILLAVEWLL